jgi:hypothetical protein
MGFGIVIVGEAFRVRESRDLQRTPFRGMADKIAEDWSTVYNPE